MDRVDELNERLSTRMTPYINKTPNFDPRPASTKYATFPILDSRTKPGPNAIQATHLDVGVDNETELWRGFTPATGDAKYKVTGGDYGAKPDPKHDLLFQKPALVTSGKVLVPAPNGFYNHTRTQLRNSQF
jgi:hypothetical protein